MKKSNLLAIAVLVVSLILLAAVSNAQEAGSGQEEVLLEWNEPTTRENGESMEPEEIGGYELRFYENFGPDYEAVLLQRNETPITSHTLLVPNGDHQFSLAVYDTDGLYSEFVNLTAEVEGEAPPNSALDFRYKINKATNDPVANCNERVNCTIF